MSVPATEKLRMKGFQLGLLLIISSPISLLAQIVGGSELKSVSVFADPGFPEDIRQAGASGTNVSVSVEGRTSTSSSTTTIVPRAGVEGSTSATGLHIRGSAQVQYTSSILSGGGVSDGNWESLSTSEKSFSVMEAMEVSFDWSLSAIETGSLALGGVASWSLLQAGTTLASHSEDDGSSQGEFRITLQPGVTYNIAGKASSDGSVLTSSDGSGDWSALYNVTMRPVPEPAAAMLLAVGGVLMGTRRGRQRAAERA